MVPVEAFFVFPGEDLQNETVLQRGEIVTQVLLPSRNPRLRSSYRKVRARRSWDFALAGVALAVEFEEDRVTKARVVFSGAAPAPWRSREVEEVIIGKRLADKTLKNAAEAGVRQARPLEHNGYKVPLFRAVVEEALRGIAKGESG